MGDHLDARGQGPMHRAYKPRKGVTLTLQTEGIRRGETQRLREGKAGTGWTLIRKVFPKRFQSCWLSLKTRPASLQ